jgi:hypothetical protein
MEKRSAVAATCPFAVALLLITVQYSVAKQATATPGSPDATTTIDGRQLPPPPQKFEGEDRPQRCGVEALLAARVVPPKGAWNILLIMTDDTRFRCTGTFGHVIPTPTLDKVAARGLR